MTSRKRPTYRDEDSTTKWVVIFVLLSLFAHALIILAVILVAVFVPPPKLEAPPSTSPTVNVTMMPPPPPQKRPFMPTTPQANVPPKQSLVESNNDTQLTSQSQKARADESIMPDVVSKHPEGSLHESPSVTAPPKPPSNPSPPTPPQTQPKPQQENPPQPQKPPPPKPEPPKPPTPQVVKPPVDPTTGLPVLPAINAPTLAPPSPVNPNKPRPAIPSPIIPSVAEDTQGRAGMSGQPTPEAMATDLGRYKAYIYGVVGSYWYPQVNKSFQVLPVGMVHIKFTIHSDGTISDVVVLDGNEPNLQLLMSISKNALIQPAPYKPFTDAMIKQVGESYTDDFTFSVYSP